MSLKTFSRIQGKLEGQDITNGEMVKKFGYFKLELEASIGCKALKIGTFFFG